MTICVYCGKDPKVCGGTEFPVQSNAEWTALAKIHPSIESSRQMRRQHTRDTGRYRAYPKCEICRKTIPHGEYYSDPRVDTSFDGRGLQLCPRCALRLRDLPDAEALKALEAKHGPR